MSKISQHHTANKIIQGIKYPSRNGRFLDLAGNRVTLLAGAGRSGTTWVQTLINYQQDHRILFEPFWFKKVAFLSGFTAKGYIRETNRDPAFCKPALRILKGDFRNEWADQLNGYRFFYLRRLIKDIRVNLCLKWLYNLMPELKIVLLLRHPCAVSASQIRMGWGKSPTSRSTQKWPASRFMLNHKALYEDFLKPFESLFHDPLTGFEHRILRWAIQNYVPLRQFQPGEIYLLFYEKLLAEPERELAGLFNFLELPLNPAVFDILNKPSSTSMPDTGFRNPDNRLQSWRNQVSREQLKSAIKILTRFGFDHIYNDDLLPNTAAAHDMLKQNL